jgi:hypothetical protein
VSGTVPTFAGGDSIIPAWRITHSESAKALIQATCPIDLLDDDAAWDEAAAACSDMIRDTIERLGDSPEWRLEVADASGTIRHLFRLTAETFDP